MTDRIKGCRTTVEQLSHQATRLFEGRQYDRAEGVATRACDLARQCLGDNDPGYATTLYTLAWIRGEMGDYAEAEPLHRQALDIRRKALGEEHPDFVQSLNNLAWLYHEMANYTKAKPLFEQALEINREVLGEEHPAHAVDLNNLAGLHKAMGNYAEAEPLYHQALEVCQTALGEEHPHVAVILNNLAESYREMGDYAEAEPLHRQALEIRRKALGEDHPDFARQLNNLAALYQNMGNRTDAERLYRQALEIRRKALGEEHPGVAVSLNNLAELYDEMGNYAEAEPLYHQALAVCRKALGEEHPDFAQSLNNLAGLYHEMGNRTDAERLYRQALEIRRKALGEEHPGVAVSLNNLAELYDEMGNYAEAEPLYHQALAVCRKALGEEHPRYADHANNLASLYAATHRESEALTLMKQATDINDRMIGQVFSIGSETHRMAYVRMMQGNLAAFLSLILEYFYRSSTGIQVALNVTLRRKAIGAEALAVQRDAILGGNYPELTSSLQTLRTLRAEIAQNTLAEPDPKSVEAHRRSLAEKTARKERLEGELSSQIPEMNLERHLRVADRQAVARALLEDSTLVEFARFGLFDFQAIAARDEPQWKAARYLAFVLPAREPDNVRMIDLGEAEPIDQMIESFRASIIGEAERDFESSEEVMSVEPRHVSVRSDRSDLCSAILATRHARPKSASVEDSDSRSRAGRALRKVLFEPLIAALDGRKRLFVAPDGDLARLPFEVLPDNNGGHLIDEYEISYLGVGRDVLRFGGESTVRPGPPLVVADPDFDLNSAGLRSPSKTTPFQRLEGTRKEGQQIAKVLAARSLVGAGALEALIKDSRSPRILHLATHGFFLPDAPREPNEERLRPDTIGRSGGDPLGARLGQVHNPLLRSGLALAGANSWLENGDLPDEAEDGLLTAEDVTGMDLLTTEMVVLSACETGLGEVHVGEGVYGLRRAFALAGAKTLVMSLWKVPDEQTQELMEDFYRRLLEGQPRARALREAQLAMKERYPDPYFWGAFICQGDPGPLSQRDAED